MIEEDLTVLDKHIKRIEKKVDLLFKLCFKNESNFTFGSFLWDEIKECVPLFNISAKKVNIKDFPTEEEIEKYLEKTDKLRAKLKKKFDDYAKKHNEEKSKLRAQYGYSGLEDLENQYWRRKEEYDERNDELSDIRNTIETLTDDWFRDTYFGEFNKSNCVYIKGLKDSIERNYRAQFVNDLLKVLGIKRREDDCSEYISKAMIGNKELKEIFKKIDNLK